jgi:hypothetical protein
MPKVITKICGIWKIRNTLSNSLCLVVRESKMAMDTEVITLKINRPAADKPCFVMTNFRLNRPQIKTGSPGLKKLNRAGMAMKSENRGMKIHVLLRKNHRLIPDKEVKAKTERYIDAI